MVKKYSYIFLLLIGVLPFEVCAQRYDFQVYSVNNGLPHGQVSDIHQTEDGYMWLGTYGGGLTKFDGQGFQTYTTEDGLRDNMIGEIYHDSYQTLWVSTESGNIARMQGDSLIYPFTNTALDTSKVTSIKQFNDKLWLGTEAEGIYQYDYESDSLRTITKSDGLKSNKIISFLTGSDENIWIATQEGLSVHNGKQFIESALTKALDGKVIFAMAFYSNSPKWFATRDGLEKWDGKSLTPRKLTNSVTIDGLTDLEVDAHGRLWVGTIKEGIFLLDNDSVMHITRKNGLSSNYIYDLYKDRDNHIWIGTDQDGVNLFRGSAFTFLGDESGLTSSLVLSLHRDSQDRTWVGTYDGIFFRAKDDVTFSEEPFPGNYKEPRNVWDIVELEDGSLLFLMPDDAIYRYNAGEFQNFSKQHDFDYWFTYDLFVDSQNVLWIGTSEGLFKYDGELTQYTMTDGLAGNVVQDLFEYNNELWIGTLQGVSKFDGNSFTNITSEDGIGHKEVHHIAADSRGNIWLGTGGGVSLLNLDSEGNVKKVMNFGKKEGMKLLTTQTIWFDDKGQLWHGTNGGIHMLDVPKYWKTGEMAVTHYPLSQSDIGVEFNHKALLPISKKEAWLGTMNGILQLFPDQLRDSAQTPSVFITDIRQNNQPIDWSQHKDSLGYKYGRVLYPQATFAYDENTYSFKFAGLDFSYPKSVEYRYKLQGFEEHWSTPTSITTANYTNLNPGEYTFSVQARSHEGHWSTQSATYNFQIAYPFWQTYWFYLLILCITSGLIYGYTQMRVQMVEKKNLKEQVEKQTQDLRTALEEKEVLIKEIHHRVKNNLAVISGLLELQREYTDDNFSTKVLQESQRRVQTIAMIHEKLYQNDRLSQINFQKYIGELIEAVSYTFSHFEKDITVEKSIEDINLGIDQGIPCGLIINELLSNAFEHAFKDKYKGKIMVLMEQKEDSIIRLIVSDNGNGLPENFDDPEKKMHSLGMVLVESLVQQIEGELTIQEPEQGVKFIIEFKKEAAPLKIPVEA